MPDRTLPLGSYAGTARSRARRSAVPAADVTRGFACKIEADTDLGCGMLIAEVLSPDSGALITYLPISACCSLAEARVIASSSEMARTSMLVVFRVWARGILGVMAVAGSFEAQEVR